VASKGDRVSIQISSDTVSKRDKIGYSQQARQNWIQSASATKLDTVSKRDKIGISVEIGCTESSPMPIYTSDKRY
jgi:hypothetical protein